MRRMLVLAALLAALLLAPIPASADDGSGMRVPPASDVGTLAR